MYVIRVTRPLTTSSPVLSLLFKLDIYRRFDDMLAAPYSLIYHSLHDRQASSGHRLNFLY